MELDENLKDILADLRDWKSDMERIMEKCRIQDKAIITLKDQLHFSTEEVAYLRDQLDRKQHYITQYREILSHYTSVEEKCSKLAEENKLLQVQLSNEKEKNDELGEHWKAEKEKIEINLQNELKVVKDVFDKKVAKLTTEGEKTKKISIHQMEFLKQEHKKEIEKYKQTLSQTVTNYEEKLIKMNGDLASAQIEIRNLRQRCAASAQLYKVGSSRQSEDKINSVSTKPILTQSPVSITTVPSPLSITSVPIPVVTIQSLNNSIPNRKTESQKILPKQIEIQTTKVKFPAVKKRKLYTWSN